MSKLETREIGVCSKLNKYTGNLFEFGKRPFVNRNPRPSKRINY